MGNKIKLPVFIIVAFFIIIAAGAVYFSRVFVPKTLKEGSYTTERIGRGEVMSSISATGVVDSESEVLILSPGTGVIESILAEAGSRVEKGDVIMQLNTEGVRDDIERLTDQLEVSQNNLERTRLSARSTQLDLDYNEEVKKLRITSLESQLADQQQLLEVGGISPARISQTKQEITLAEKDQQTMMEKNSIRLKQLEAEEKGLLLQIRMQEKQLEERKRLLQEMTIRAPSSGIILSVTGKVGEKVSTDNLLIRMSNLSSFKITGSVEEQHAKNIKTGNRVLVEIDNENLEGTIGNITPMVENNKVQFNVHLKESSHPKLIANQQVQLQIINNFVPDALRIKKQPGFESGNVQSMFVIEDNKAIKKEFTLGTAGNDYYEIISGLNEGDIVITTGIHASRNLNEIEIQH